MDIVYPTVIVLGPFWAEILPSTVRQLLDTSLDGSLLVRVSQEIKIMWEHSGTKGMGNAVTEASWDGMNGWKGSI